MMKNILPSIKHSTIKGTRRLLTTEAILESPPKKIILSGPSGFLGSRVLDSILDSHALRMSFKIDPGEIILMSSSPGKLMGRLTKKYGLDTMRTIRASRVDYYSQHSIDTWRDHLGSLGVEGENAVFVNLAAVAGPKEGKYDAMMDVNYNAPVAAASACERLGFGHWVQSSTQATNAERAGQVPYSKGKAMLDFALSRMSSLPVSVACLGLLYSKADGIIGQERKGTSRINLIDLSLLPLTPIMGDGCAPLQPQEVCDAAERIAFLALTDPSKRGISKSNARYNDNTKSSHNYRVYDAVGPETMSILEMLEKFARYQGNFSFRPVFIDYRNMERVLNIQSLGNLNRQFVSLLRSEQEIDSPIIGNPDAWEKVLGDSSKLTTLDEAFHQNETFLKYKKYRRFPYFSTLRWVLKNPKVIFPGIDLSFEIIQSFLIGSEFSKKSKRKNCQGKY